VDRRWAAALALSITLLAVYSPVLRFDYLYHDDWLFFKTVKTSCAASPLYRYTQIRGSLLTPYLHCALFRSFDTIETAWVARSTVVGGILVFALVQLAFFRAIGLGWLAAGPLAFGTSVLPGVLAAGFWITAGATMFSLVPSACAALLTAFSLRPDVGPVRRTAFLVMASGLVLACLFMSQIAAMYFWALTAAMLATNLSREPSKAVRSLVSYVLVGAIPMAAYFIWFRHISGFAALLRAEDPMRGTLFADLAGTATWYITSALPLASSLWLVDLPLPLEVVVLGVFWLAALTCAARAARMAARRADRTGTMLAAAYPVLLAGLCILAFLPSLVTQFRVPVYRNLIPLSALMFLTGAIHLGENLRAGEWPTPVRGWIAGVFVIGLFVLTELSLAGRMVIPAAHEYSFVRSTLRDARPSGRPIDAVHVILPRSRSGLSTDEIDALTSQFFQDIRPMIEAVQRELGLNLWVTLHPRSENFRRADAVTLDFGALATTLLSKAALGQDANVLPIPLWAYGSRYYLFSFQGLIYGVSWRPGYAKWQDAIGPSPRVVPGATVDDVIRRLPPDDTIDPQPNLLHSVRAYNLVSYRGRIYAIPQGLGDVGEVDWHSGRVASLPGVFVDRTVEAALRRLAAVE